jgi:hypothetical protein
MDFVTNPTGSENGTSRVGGRLQASEVQSLLPTQAPDYLAGTISVVAALNGRASSQKLCFHGIGGASEANGLAPGANDFAVFATCTLSSLPAVQADITAGAANAFFLFATNAGDIQVEIGGGTHPIPLGYRLPVGVETQLAYVRAGQYGRLYVNGQLVNLVTDTNNYSAPVLAIGGTADFWQGSLFVATCNFAPTAAQVCRIAQSGTFPAEWYNGTGDPLTRGSFSNYQYASFVASSPNGFTAAAASGYAQANSTTNSRVSVKGARYRVEFDATLNSGAAPLVYLSLAFVGNPQSNQAYAINGHNVMEFVMARDSANPNQKIFAAFDTQGATSYQIGNCRMASAGLTSAPDVRQPGAGLFWYDGSGSRADYTLGPGVTWAIPTASIYGRRVPVPIVANQSGQPGDWASDSVHIYTYIGDGISHLWNVTAASVFNP